MIIGVVNTQREAVVSLSIQGPSGQVRVNEAVIDTGFGGFLTLPSALIAELDLSYEGFGRATLGDGSEVSFAVHGVSVLWDGDLLHGLADAADTTPLVGMAMLDGYRLCADVHEGSRLTIERLP